MKTKHHILTFETPWAGPTPFQLDEELRNFRHGEVVNSPKGQPVFELRVDNGADYRQFPPCDLHRAEKGQLLLTKRVINVLDDFKIKYQSFDCTVNFKPTNEMLDYKLVNLIGNVKALDVDQSECEVDEEGLVETFYTLRLDESKLENIHMSRLFECFSLILISEQVKSALVDRNFTGIQIMEDHEWQPGII
jgi:hypothetical protein